MALWRAAGLCRLALRTQFAAVRLLSAAVTGGEAPSGEDKRRRVDLAALRRERPLRPPGQRTQPEPPRKGYQRPWATHEQLQLNKAIQECLTIEAVLDVAAAHRSILNGVNLLTISRRVREPEAATWLSGDARFAQLMNAAESLLSRMGAQELANSLYACGKLGIMPSWLPVYWGVSAAKLNNFKPQELSNTLYACGQLSIAPPADWLQRYWDASAAKLNDFKPQELSITLYACGQLSIAPPADWLQRYWDASAAKLNDFKPQELSNTLYACGQLGITPPADWLQRYWDASAAKLAEFKPQELSITLYACGQLGIAPSADWLQRFWDVSASMLSESNAQDFANMLYACGQLGVTAPADWLQRFWDASASKLGEFNAQELSNTLYACGQLGINPPADWRQAFARECERSLPDMEQQGLANTGIALATLALWELPLWPGLWERLCCLLSRNIPNWNAEDRLHAMQLYQAHTAAAVERPGLLAAPSPELLTAARKCWVDGLSTDDNKSSRLHADVSACLTRMGVAHANERWCERAERSIDISIEGAVPVALEVDGPAHFLQDGRQDGRTLLRNRMLAAHGWRVVVVDYRSWKGGTR